MNQAKMEREYQQLFSTDSAGHPFEGGKCYKLHLEPEIPASEFWSVIVYDKASNLIIRNHQSWPSVHSNCKNLIMNGDRSVDIWFCPDMPAGKTCNWVQTNPGKAWHIILRLYYPLEPVFNKSWEPGEIEEVKII